jgi:L-malate glycosyltransferase
MNKIKILHIIKSLGRGGAEMLLPETLKLHDQEKFEFHYIYFLPWKDQMVSSIEEAGGKVTCLTANNNIQLLLQYNKVITYCRLNNIDLIHCHLPWAGFLGRIVYKLKKIPLIYSEHNMQERYHIITKFINKTSFNSQSLALGVSYDVSNSIIQNIAPNVKINTLLNGVNTKTFQRDIEKGQEIRNSLGIPNDAKVIGNVAVFRFQKRLVEWLNVFKEVEKVNDNIYGIIVGAGPLEQEIKDELKRLGLQDKIFLPGLITEVKPYLSAMDIFMMSSSFEGLPIALLEAMSMECAIVSTDAGGIKEVIRDNIDGKICKVEDWKELSNLCLELINDRERLQKMQQASRVRVVKDFSLSQMILSLEKIYTEFAHSEMKIVKENAN